MVRAGSAKLKQAALFFSAAFALLAAVFGDALLGRSLLAPVDIAPALWAKYSYVDPTSNGVPRNQHVVDQLGYDLPLQHLMHEAWRRGEVPWWNPYTLGGRPLLADAHCNGADPLRIATYLAVPDFVLAYNWTRAIHWLWGALGLFFLLRRAGNEPLLAGLLALAGEVAGWKVQLFGHPWVEGALCWYPWLWLAWSAAWERNTRAVNILAAAAVAAILLAGNLQSHAYLPLFALAVAWGWSGRSGAAWLRALKVLAPSLAAGALLAAPVLLAELELFALNVRPLGAKVSWPVWNTPFALAAVHPWLLGTPRIGAYMTHGVGALAFVLWSGSAIMPLAALGSAREATDRSFFRTSLALLVGFLVIISTPLSLFLYARYGGLAVMGLLLLVGIGVRRLQSGWRPPRWLAIGLVITALMMLCIGDIFGWLLYPHFRDRYAAKLTERMQSDGFGGRSARLRAEQANKVPEELSLRNPEVCAGALTFLLCTLMLARRKPVAPRVWFVLLGLNLLAPLLSACRLIPRTPLDQWQRLLAGSAEQRETIQRANPAGLRVEETVTTRESPQSLPDSFAALFPEEFASLYRVHVLHGYAALIPPNSYTQAHPGPPSADLSIESDGSVTERMNRFRMDGTENSPRIVSETLTEIEVALPPKHGAILQWADTAYPGWSAAIPASGQACRMDFRGLSSQINVPPDADRIRLTYRPSFLTLGLWLAVLGIVMVFIFPFERKLPQSIR
jgi:hypothetical protein